MHKSIRKPEMPTYMLQFLNEFKRLSLYICSKDTVINNCIEFDSF